MDTRTIVILSTIAGTTLFYTYTNWIKSVKIETARTKSLAEQQIAAARAETMKVKMEADQKISDMRKREALSKVQHEAKLAHANARHEAFTKIQAKLHDATDTEEIAKLIKELRSI